MNDEEKLLISSVKEFCEKNVDSLLLEIEREGISKDLTSKIAQQGFLALRLPPEKGGVGVSRETYVRILAEFALHSASVATMVMTVNSVILPILEKSEKAEPLIDLIVSGEEIPSIPISSDGVIGVPDYSLKLDGSKISGEVPYLLGFGWDSILAGLDSDDQELSFIREGVTRTKEYSRVGLRGIHIFEAKVDSAAYELFGITKVRNEFSKTFSDIDLEIAAIAIGIAENSIEKAIEYSTVRNTFEHPLKDYQPIAFPLIKLKSEVDVAKWFLYGKDKFTEQEAGSLRLMAEELAKNASRQSVQTHGGYGYLEDFGIEKNYRDSMALSIIFGTKIALEGKLSRLVFESESGFI